MKFPNKINIPKRNMKNNKQDINDIDKLLLKTK